LQEESNDLFRVGLLLLRARADFIFADRSFVKKAGGKFVKKMVYIISTRSSEQTKDSDTSLTMCAAAPPDRLTHRSRRFLCRRT
jgi:hypothetical protein